MSNNWINYWSGNNIWSSSSIWKKNSKILSLNLNKIVKIKNKSILDIGCGTGELIDNFIPEAKKIYGVDISSNYIKTCKLKFKNQKKVVIKLFKSNFKKLNKLNQKFDIIVCNSVIQYFSYESQIIELVKIVKKVSKKGSIFLISDIMDINDKKNYLKLLYYSIIRGYLFLLLKQYLILLINPKYRRLEKKYKLLRIDSKKVAKKSVC